MKSFLIVLLYYALIPFAASLPGLALSLCGASGLSIIVVPALTAAIYYLFRKRMDLEVAVKTNGTIFLFLLGSFTLLMLITSGNTEGRLMGCFSWLIMPFAPIMLIHVLMGQNMLLYVTAMLSYAAAWAAAAWIEKVRIKKFLVPAALALICILINMFLFANRPSVKYGGHGFAYMHGYSSTDFGDYMVYSGNSKLASLDSAASLTIEAEEDMPVLDGAEACYPLYAAFAKAVYTDIDTIEKNWLRESDNQSCNGKIVTFTNTIRGFVRLLYGAKNNDGSGDGVDMFFGARPSAAQLAEAAELGVELEITPIAREAFVFFVEADNPVDDLTSDQLRAIYHGDIANWSQLGGRDQPILAFQRPVNSGSQTMMEFFMGEVSLKEPKTYERVSAMEGVIRQVAQYHNEDGAIGYSFRYFLEELHQEKNVKMLSVDGVYPSLENIENGSYPLVTNVCLITRKDDPNPYVRRMTEFILSGEGQTIVRRTGYAGLTE